MSKRRIICGKHIIAALLISAVLLGGTACGGGEPTPSVTPPTAMLATCGKTVSRSDGVIVLADRAFTENELLTIYRAMY